MTARLLRAAPAVSLGALLLWTAVDVAAVTAPGWPIALFILLVLGSLLVMFRVMGRAERLTRNGVFVVGAAYILAHVVELGVDVVPALVYVTLGIVHVELRSLAERFGPMYVRSLAPEARRRIDAALARASARLAVAAGLAVLVPIVAADLALSGVLPARSIPTAIILAGGLIAVVALLALLPVLRREREASGD